MGESLLLLAGTLSVVILIYFSFRTLRKRGQLEVLRGPRNESIFSTKDNAVLSDCQIHFTVSGSGPPVILLHGWGANIFCWRFLTPLLTKKYTVYEIDLPGFGRSTKVTTIRYSLDDQSRRIVEFMEQKNIKKAYFVGSSLGGAISLWMGIKFPEKVISIVTLAPAAHRKIMPTSIHYLSPLGRVVPSFLGQRIGKYSLNQVLTNKELINDETMLGYLDPLNEPNSFVTLLKAAEALRDERLPESLAQMKVPVKVLYGERDNVVKKRHIDEILKCLPQLTQYRVHSKAGHHPQEDDPQWVFDEIISFFS